MGGSNAFTSSVDVLTCASNGMKQSRIQLTNPLLVSPVSADGSDVSVSEFTPQSDVSVSEFYTPHLLQ